MPWGYAAVAAASLGGAVLTSNAVGNAAKTQTAGADQATALQKYMYDTSRSDQAPYRAAGVGALGQLSAALGIAPPAGSGNAGGGNILANASGMPTGTGNLTPGMIAAQASGPHSGNGTVDNLLLGGGVAGGLFRKNATPIQDIAGALKLGRTITDAQWAQAGYGPGGADRNAPTLPTIPLAQANPTVPPPGSGAPGQTPQDSAVAAFQASPGYQFQFDQGVKATSQGMAAQGLGKSGAAQQALTQFGQGVANQEYGSWMNGLRSLAGIGQVATGQGQQANQNYATQGGNTLQNAAAARASGYVGSANAWSGVGNQLAQLAGTYQSQNNNYNPAMGGNYQGNYLAPFNSSAAAQGF